MSLNVLQMPIEATGEEMVQGCCDCFNDPHLLSVIGGVAQRSKNLT
jgi:hypothetical protein